MERKIIGKNVDEAIVNDGDENSLKFNKILDEKD